MDNEILNYLDAHFREINGKIDTISSTLTNACTTLAVHQEKISTIEDRCGHRAEDVKALRSLESKFNEHVMKNGFKETLSSMSDKDVKEDIKEVKKVIRPLIDIRSGWAVILAIISVIGVLTFVQIKFTAFAEQMQKLEKIK